MQGIFNSHSPRPRYSFIWDVNMVMSYNDSLPINEYLSLKELSVKLIVLMALYNAHRSSDLITLNLHSQFLD